MPRLSTSLIRKARAVNPLLPYLLRTCRDLPSARNELRWLREHAYETHRQTFAPHIPRFATGQGAELGHLTYLCQQRGLGVPLQYLIGREYFGDLEIECPPKVLIPRPETADIVLELARRLQAGIKKGIVPRPLRVLDLCCGTGCMAFLLHTELQKMYPAGIDPTLTLGVDCSSAAIGTAKMNRARLGLRKKDFRGSWESPIKFILADVLPHSSSPSNKRKGSLNVFDVFHQKPEWLYWDVVMSNPPYISQEEFETTKVERSVRLFEPTQALVPPASRLGDTVAALYEADGGGSSALVQADLFYPNILELAAQVRAKVVIMEVGGPDQASRVQEMAKRGSKWDNVDMWRDGMDSSGNSVLGKQRAVVCWRGQGAEWLGH